jgi:hypothetical protein
MDAFVSEGIQLGESYDAFCEQGGFCREHAWLFHRRSALAMTGVPVVKMYEALVRSDIDRLERLKDDLSGVRRAWRHRLHVFERRGCAVCQRGRERLQVKADGAVRALADAAVRDAYLRSDGLCVQHLDLVGSRALAVDAGVARFLVDDLRRRLEELEGRLVRFERTRDYRFAAERTEADHDAWTDVVRSYVGDPHAVADW